MLSQLRRKKDAVKLFQANFLCNIPWFCLFNLLFQVYTNFLLTRPLILYLVQKIINKIHKKYKNYHVHRVINYLVCGRQRCYANVCEKCWYKIKILEGMSILTSAVFGRMDWSVISNYKSALHSTVTQNSTLSAIESGIHAELVICKTTIA